MGLTYVGKTIGSLVGLSGIGSAVSVPLVLQAKGYIGQTFVNTVGKLTNIEIKHCDNPTPGDKFEVEFGEQEYSSICGQEDSNTQAINNTETFNTFLKERGDERNQDGKNSANQNQGTAQCVGSEYYSQGLVLVDSSDNSGLQYLGKCGDSTLEDTPFIKKRKQSASNSEKLTLEFCSQVCGKDIRSVQNTNTKTLQKDNERTENGKTVKFYSSKNQTEDKSN